MSRSEALIFLVVGLVGGSLLYLFTYLIEGILGGIDSREGKRRMLRWQKAFFRGRYPIGSSTGGTSSKLVGALILFMRGFIVLWLVLLVIVVVRALVVGEGAA